MPVCSVLSCKNYGGKTDQSNGHVSYHRFPDNPIIKEKWMEATGRINWFPTKFSRICSVHFDPACFKETKQFRRLLSEAIPTIDVLKTFTVETVRNETITADTLPISNAARKIKFERNTTNSAILSDTSPVQVCHVCLATDTRLHALRDYQLDGMYEQLTGLTISAGLSVQLCPLCTRRLTNHARFRECARASRRLLTNVLSRQRGLSSKNKKIAEQTLARLPPFTIQHKQQYDLDIVHEDRKPPWLKDVKVIEKLQTENVDGQYVLEKVPFITYSPIKEENEDSDLVGEGDVEREAVFMVLEDAPPKEDCGETIDKVEFLDENAWCSAIDNSSVDTCDELVKEKNVSVQTDNKIAIKKRKQAQKYSKEAEIRKQRKAGPNENLDSDDTEKNDESFSAIDDTTASSSKDNRVEEKIKKTVDVETVKMVPNRKRRRVRKVSKEAEYEDINQTLFTITELTQKDQLDIIEKRKESRNFKNAPHKCTLCYRGFLDEEAYERHMFKHSDQCGEIECEVCKFRFKSYYKLRGHLAKCHFDLFKCNTCGFTTQSKTTALTHQRWHNGKRYQCTQCPENFEKRSSYLSHVRIVHPSDVSCQLCGYSFINQKGLAQHFIRTHQVDRQQLITEGPRCEQCDKIFATEEALSTHRKIQHERFTRKRNAPVVKRTYQSVKKEKVLNSDGTWSVACSECDKSFQTSHSYHIHMRAVHKAIPFERHRQCHVCGKTYRNQGLLSLHMDLHDESVTYPCPHCGKRFKTRSRMYVHRKTHNMTSRPACPLCPMTFSCASNRDRHVKYAHKTVKDVKCEYCPKTFKTVPDKRQHQLYIHLKKPWPKRVRK